jgi:hypothetical protein
MSTMAHGARRDVLRGMLVAAAEPGSGFDMHQTPTIDFLVVVSGRMELLMDEGSAKLGPGDCVVQRGRDTRGGSLETSRAPSRPSSFPRRWRVPNG